MLARSADKASDSAAADVTMSAGTGGDQCADPVVSSTSTEPLLAEPVPRKSIRSTVCSPSQRLSERRSGGNDAGPRLPVSILIVATSGRKSFMCGVRYEIAARTVYLFVVACSTRRVIHERASVSV